MGKMEAIFRIDYSYIGKKDKYLITFNYSEQGVDNNDEINELYMYDKTITRFKRKLDEIKYIVQRRELYYSRLKFNINISAFIQETNFCINDINNKILVNYMKIVITNGQIYHIKELSINEDMNKTILKFLKACEAKIKLEMDEIIEIKGIYDVEFCSQAASYLIHEVIGHTFEFDNAHLNSKLLTLVNQNKQLLDSSISIYDDPFYDKEILDFGSFDITGNELQKTEIIKNGFFNAYINTERASSINETNQYRMTNLIFKANLSESKSTYEYKSKHLYVDQISYGYLDAPSGNFAVVADIIYLKDKNGMNLGYKQYAKISGNIFDLFTFIHILPGPSEYHIGLCIKGNQQLPVGMKTPPLLVENLEVS